MEFRVASRLKCSHIRALERIPVAELKTKVTKASVAAYLQSIPGKDRRRDCVTLRKLMEKVTGSKPLMWGSRMVGFGSYHYVYASGREGDWFMVGFSPRKQDLTIYTMCGLEQNKDLLPKLGKFKSSRSCIYIKSLEDIDLGVLEKILKRSVEHLKSKY